MNSTMESTIDNNNINNVLVEQLNFSLGDRLLTICLTAVLVLMIAVTAVGNLFVIAAVMTEKHLRKPQNYLVVSLAFADMAVSIGVLPLSMLYEVADHRWLFGAAVCDVWIFIDVTACSASILNMVAIAFDRYFAVTDIHYSQTRRPKYIVCMIAIVWAISLMLSVFPIVGWKDKEFYNRISDQVCLISQELSFQVFSTITAFYAPLVIIVTLHICIYRAAKRRIRRRAIGGSAKRRKAGLATTGDGISGNSSTVFFGDSSPLQKLRSMSSRSDKTTLFSTSTDRLPIKTGYDRHLTPLALFKLPEKKIDSVIAVQITNGTSHGSQKNNGTCHNSKNNGCSHDFKNSPKKLQPVGKPARVLVDSDASDWSPPGRRSSSVGRMLAEFSRLELSLVCSIASESDVFSSKSFEEQLEMYSMSSTPLVKRRKLRQRLTMELKKERKAFRTLVIVTATFILCWLPFFITALARPLCNCEVNATMDAVFSWLGWSNSLLNPCIYTIFSPDFRKAFRKMLCQRKRSRI